MARKLEVSSELLSDAPVSRGAGGVRKIKLSVSLDAEAVEELRMRAGVRGFSAAINAAIHKEVERLRREQALDAWLSELEDKEGPVSPDVIRRWEQEWQP